MAYARAIHSSVSGVRSHFAPTSQGSLWDLMIGSGGLKFVFNGLVHSRRRVAPPTPVPKAIF